MTPARCRAIALASICAGAVACGSESAPPRAADPGAPAVVTLPPPVLPSDTAKPDTMERVRARLAEAKMVLAQNYAVLGAAMVFGDRRMIASQYTADAVLATPDSAYRGPVAIANALAQLGPPRSLQEFRRTSLDVRIADSTVADSGTFVAISRRAGADSVVERGTYRATWRMRAPPTAWLIEADELHPATRPKKRG